MMYKYATQHKLKRLFIKRTCRDCGCCKIFNLWECNITKYFDVHRGDFITRRSGFVYCRKCYDKLTDQRIRNSEPY